MASLYNTATFNVGGTRYEVSKSLLDQFPDSMLTKSIAEVWHKNPDKEIFIERNSRRFELVLDCMRDGKAVIPLGITKSSLLADLEYLGINYDEASINDKEALTKSLPIVITNTQALINNLNRRSTCDILAVLCISKYLEKGGSASLQINNDAINYNVVCAFEAMLSRDSAATSTINQSLGKVGLEFVQITTSRSNSGKTIYSKTVEVREIKTDLP